MASEAVCNAARPNQVVDLVMGSDFTVSRLLQPIHPKQHR